MATDSTNVSSGNNPADDGDKIDPAITQVTRKIDANTFEVTVDQLDVTHFKNVRTAFSEDKIAEYRQSLKDQGQIQNVSVAALENGKLAVFAGFSRTEAFQRNVHDPLIKKWNQENNLSSTDPQFLVVTNPEHRKVVANAYPEDFNKEKEKKHNLVRVFIDETVRNAGQARLKGFIENFQRADLSLADTFKAIEDMIEKDGITAQSVARSLKKSPGAISQYRRANKLGATLREFLVTPDAGEVINESDLAKLKEDVNVLMNEYDRRISLPKDAKDYYEQAISLSHVREFSQTVVPGTMDEKAGDWVCPLTRAQTLTLLCDLVGADEKTHKLRAGQSPKNFPVWSSIMKSMAETTKKRREGGVEEAVAEEAVATDGAATGTVAGLAEQQVAKEVSTGNVAQAAAAEANADAVIAPAPGSEKTSAADSEALAEELVGGASDDDSEEPLEPTEAGLTKKKTQSAPIAQAKVKDANTILSVIGTYVDYINESELIEEVEPNAGQIAGALQAAQLGYEMLSIDSVAKKLQQAATEYQESLEAYIVGLEDFAEKATRKHKVPAFTMERPHPVLPPELQAEEVQDDDVEEELIAGDDDASDDDAGDDELREIEDAE